MMILIAAGFLSLGLANLNFGSTWRRGQYIRLLIGLPIVLFYVYASMPAMVFPQALTYLLLTLVPNAVYSALTAARDAVIFRHVVSLRRVSMLPYVVAIAVLGLFAGVLFIAPVVDAGGLRDVPQVTVSVKPPPNASLRHVRAVPVESAIFAGEKAIGQLGAYYFVGSYNIQVENGRLVWVAPLEFQGFVQWLTRRASPGVIVVSAENPNADAELRQRAPMRYIPSALLNDNLYRHVYMRYGAEQILETTLQLDDRGDPWYLCTLGRPTIGWSGQKVTGVAIVNPATGQMRRIARAQFPSLPKWVRRIYPPDLALAYNEWFGLYAHGLVNAVLARRDVHVPARDEVFGLLVDQDAFVWFVDHTSPMRTDQSMTGFTYMDTVSGKMTYYTASGGEFNSGGAENAVASNPIVRQGRLQPTQPILYNVYGQNTWVVPLVAPDTGKFQTLALVQARNGRVMIGNPTSASPQDDAFAQYAAMLGAAAAGDARALAPRAVAGVLDRVAAGSDGSVYFTLQGDARVYVVSAAGDAAALLARSGDRVAFHVSGSAWESNGALKALDFTNASVRR
jgi:hypothetical protein